MNARDRERLDLLLARLQERQIHLWVDEGKLRFRAPAGAMTSDLRDQLSARKADILALLAHPMRAPILRSSVQEHYELSQAQRRLWILSQLEGARAAYNVPIHLLLRGPLNRRALEFALRRVVERHESLRTRFVVVEGEPRQVIDDPSLFQVRWRDLSQRPDPDGAARDLAHAESIEPFDLERGPLFRVVVAELGPCVHALLMTMHHIVSDGWSLSVLMRELSSLYQAMVADRADPVEPLPAPVLQYRDYACWQNTMLAAGHYNAHRDYWLKHLCEPGPRLELPVDAPRPAQQTFRGAMETFAIDAERARGLDGLARRHGASLFMLLVALVKTQLFRYTGQTRLVIGTPVAGRNHPDLAEQIGFYLNTLVLVNDLTAQMPFRDLVGAVRQNALDAFEHQDYPFNRLVDELVLDRDLSRNPLFDVMVILQNAGAIELILPGVEVTSLFHEHDTSKFELTFDFEKQGDGLLLGIRYNTDLFSRARVVAMGAHFGTLVDSVLADDTAPIGRMEMLPPEEKSTVLGMERHCTAAATTSLMAHVERHVCATPERTALQQGVERLSYAALWERAGRVARALRDHGLGAGERVGLLIERSLWLPASVLGALAAGVAFIPLDTRQPAARLLAILARSDCRTVLVDKPVLADLADHASDMVQAELVSIDVTGLAESHEKWAPLAVHPEQIAYIIHTSGSTGEPKGVMISHRSLLSFLQVIGGTLSWSQDDVLLSVTTPSFDIFYLEMLVPLMNGAAVILASSEEAVDGDRMVSLLENTRVDGRPINCMQATPSTWKLLLVVGWQPERPIRILCGGEPLSPALAESLLARSHELWNLYGPTETTIWSTVCRIRDSRPPVSIGLALEAERVYVLDAELQPTPIGVSGDIYIGGDGLAHGYLNAPRLTAERFVPDPFADERGVGGQRLYRTGDIGRWLFEGGLECLGRRDGQVKVRGFRIEIAEVEHHLARIAGVQDVAVVPWQDDSGAMELAAYIVGDAAEATNLALVRDELARVLPTYMIPSYMVAIDALPRTRNDKLDRRALPDPRRSVSPVEIARPGDALEESLARIFSEILRVEVGVERSFFELGGHSIEAMTLVARIRKELEVEVALADVFSAPRVTSLAALIRSRKPSAFVPLCRVPDAARYPASDAQRRLWVLAQERDGSIAYNMPASLRLCGELDVAALRAAIADIWARHEALRTTFELEGETLWQRVSAPEGFQLPCIDVREASDPEARARELVASDMLQPFDLARGPLFRGALLVIGPREHVLALNMHHIVSDAWSMRVVARDLATLYQAALGNQAAALAPLPIQYRDYAAWQAQLDGTGVLSAQRDYWLEKLAGAPATGNLVTDCARPVEPTFAGSVVRSHLSPAELVELHGFARDHQTSVFTVLITAIKALLFRYTGQEDGVIGCVTSGREHPDLHEQVGFYVNTLALRDRVLANMSVRSLLEQVRTTVAEAFAHADYPFDRVAELLTRAGRGVSARLFDVMVDYHVDRGDWPRLPGIEVSQFLGRPPVSKFDLLFLFSDETDGLHLVLEYNSDLFDRGRMEATSSHFTALLAAMIRDPDCLVIDLPLERVGNPDPTSEGRPSPLLQDQLEQFNL